MIYTDEPSVSSESFGQENPGGKGSQAVPASSAFSQLLMSS